MAWDSLNGLIGFSNNFIMYLSFTQSNENLEVVVEIR